KATPLPATTLFRSPARRAQREAPADRPIRRRAIFRERVLGVAAGDGRREGHVLLDAARRKERPIASVVAVGQQERELVERRRRRARIAVSRDPVEQLTAGERSRVELGAAQRDAEPEASAARGRAERIEHLRDRSKPLPDLG